MVLLFGCITVTKRLNVAATSLHGIPISTFSGMVSSSPFFLSNYS
jgi:hypothetical protein